MRDLETCHIPCRIFIHFWNDKPYIFVCLETGYTQKLIKQRIKWLFFHREHDDELSDFRVPWECQAWGMGVGFQRIWFVIFSEPTLIHNMKSAYIHIYMYIYVYAPVYKISI